MLAFAVLVEDPEQWVVVVAKVECNLLSSPDYAVEHNSKFDKNKIYNCRWTVNGVVGKDAHKAYIQWISSSSSSRQNTTDIQRGVSQG